MYDTFLRERITQLRLQKGVSEYKMSYDLGRSRSYIYNISAGRNLPLMNDFFAICEYFEITPSDFFNREHKMPELISKAVEGLKTLNDSDLIMILGIINRLQKPAE